MHAYINQLAEHDVVSCLHFFCCCSSFIDSVHVALLPHHIYPSPFHLFIRSRAMFTPQRKQKNTSHLAHTKRVVGAFVSKATSCYIFCAMYTSLLCACSYVVLSIFFPSFSLFSPCHCRIHLKPIFFPSHSSFSLLLLRCRS